MEETRDSDVSIQSLRQSISQKENIKVGNEASKTVDRWFAILLASSNMFFLCASIEAHYNSTALRSYVAMISIITCLMQLIYDVVLLYGFVIYRQLKKERPKLSPEQLDAELAAHPRSIGSYYVHGIAVWNDNIKIALHFAVVVMCGSTMRWVENFALPEPECDANCVGFYGDPTCGTALQFETNDSPFLLQNLFFHTVYLVIAAYDLKSKIFSENCSKTFPKKNLKWSLKFPVLILVKACIGYLICLFFMKIKIPDNAHGCIGDIQIVRILMAGVLWSLLLTVVGFIAVVVSVKDDTRGCGFICLTNCSSKTGATPVQLYHLYIAVAVATTSNILLGFGLGIFASTDALDYLSYDHRLKGVIPSLTVFIVICLASIIGIFCSEWDPADEDKIETIVKNVEMGPTKMTINSMHIVR